MLVGSDPLLFVFGVIFVATAAGVTVLTRSMRRRLNDDQAERRTSEETVNSDTLSIDSDATSIEDVGSTYFIEMTVQD